MLRFKEGVIVRLGDTVFDGSITSLAATNEKHYLRGDKGEYNSWQEKLDPTKYQIF